mmetsp:Transcript_113887/g.332781  ORF Transcript_113887/g.332781 Transcript_113887/m.332781 type:complete len:208 (-) Transcript_113887:761-1384(-)
MNVDAIVSWRGPVKTAEGRISPHMSTKVTDMSTATTGLTSWSRKIGRASLASAFSSNRVTRSKWWSLMRGRMCRAASFCLSSFSRSLSSRQSFSRARWMISISRGSSESRPMVRPAAQAAPQMQQRAMTTLLQKRREATRASRSACVGLRHFGGVVLNILSDSQRPSAGQLTVMAFWEPPSTKAPSLHSSVYSPRYAELPDQVPMGS